MEETLTQDEETPLSELIPDETEAPATTKPEEKRSDETEEEEEEKDPCTQDSPISCKSMKEFGCVWYGSDVLYETGYCFRGPTMAPSAAKPPEPSPDWDKCKDLSPKDCFHSRSCRWNESEENCHNPLLGYQPSTPFHTKEDYKMHLILKAQALAYKKKEDQGDAFTLPRNEEAAERGAELAGGEDLPEPPPSTSSIVEEEEASAEEGEETAEKKAELESEAKEMDQADKEQEKQEMEADASSTPAAMSFAAGFSISVGAAAIAARLKLANTPTTPVEDVAGMLA